MNWNLIRRIGLWIHELPCRHGQHEWTLYRPGTVMWHRDCVHCQQADWDMSPKRNECDVDHYNNVYLPRVREKEGKVKWQQRA